MKLRTLLNKINADFLGATKASLGVEMARIPMTMTYEQALASFRNEVNRKFPPQMTSAPRARRHINEVRGGRGRSHNGGRGRGGRGGRHNSYNKRTRTDSRTITLRDGSQIEYHPSFHFSPTVFAKFKQEDKDMLQRERREYKQRNNRTGSDRSIQETVSQQQRQIQELQQQLSDQTREGERHPTDVTIGTNAQSQISQITGTTMMGGRNEQAAHRRNRQN